MLMFGGVLLAIALPDAFAEQGFVFALIYSAMQVGRSLLRFMPSREKTGSLFWFSCV